MTILTGEAERLAARLGGYAASLDAAATMLRSLAAQRDALQARVATVEDALNQPAADLKGKDD